MDDVLATGAEGPGFNTDCVEHFSNTFSVHPARSEDSTRLSSELGKAKEVRKRRGTPTSVIPLLAFQQPLNTAIGLGTTLTFFLLFHGNRFICIYLYNGDRKTNTT